MSHRVARNKMKLGLHASGKRGCTRQIEKGITCERNKWSHEGHMGKQDGVRVRGGPIINIASEIHTEWNIKGRMTGKTEP